MTIEKTPEFAICYTLMETACKVAGQLNVDPEGLMNAQAFHLVLSESVQKIPPGPDVDKLIDPIAIKVRQFIQQEIRKLKAQSN